MGRSNGWSNARSDFGSGPESIDNTSLHASMYRLIGSGTPILREECKGGEQLEAVKGSGSLCQLAENSVLCLGDHCEQVFRVDIQCCQHVRQH